MKRVLLIALLALLILPTQISAVEGRNGDDDDNEVRFEERREIRRDDDRVRIEIRQRIEDDEDELRIENKVEIQGNQFEITGQITAMGRDSITISGQQIFIDPELVGNFQERGVVAVGKTAKAEGVIIDNKLFAREITTFNGEEVRIEIKGTPDQLSTRDRGAFQELVDLINRLLASLDSIRPFIR